MAEIIPSKKYIITIKDLNVYTKVCSEHPDYYSKIEMKNYMRT
jgi:hypothetical protein